MSFKLIKCAAFQQQSCIADKALLRVDCAGSKHGRVLLGGRWLQL